MNKKIIYLFVVLMGCCVSLFAIDAPITIFPLDKYDQNVQTWVSPDAPNDKNLLVSAEYQTKRLADYHKHIFSTAPDALSPWSKNFVSQVVEKKNGVLTSARNLLADFNNQTKNQKYIRYGENYRPYGIAWFEAISDNVNLAQFSSQLTYHPNHRAIVVKNAQTRLIPTRDPSFYSIDMPGQGYPFDTIQASALWAGTPVYVLGKTKDGAWSFILTSSFMAWIESDAIAMADTAFVTRWEKLAKKNLVAITKTEAPINSLHKKYLYSAYVGTVFPLLHQGEHSSAGTAEYFLKIAIPRRDAYGKAQLQEALINREYADKMPLAATPANFSKVLATLKNRPYGWGNMYFYNDCSAELQSLYTPFGIWLPRNSSKQHMSGKWTDISTETMEQRLKYLMEQGKPLMTIVHIPGHVFMYVGKYANPNSFKHEPMVMTYQNIWGLFPQDKSSRAVIGQAVFFPLLTSYPENSDLNSQANTRSFRVINLDEWPEREYQPGYLFYGD